MSTVVGPAPAVRALWADLGDAWGPPRETRWTQPHLVADAPPLIDSDPLVRVSRPDDFSALYPACVSMYTEELGVSPELGGGAEGYRARVRQLIHFGWSFARYEEGRAVFKAEVAFATPTNAQVQGVWVTPERRGEGLAAAGMAAVVEHVRARIAPVISLYVNDWNEPARRAYDKVGFRQTNTSAPSCSDATAGWRRVSAVANPASCQRPIPGIDKLDREDRSSRPRRRSSTPEHHQHRTRGISVVLDQRSGGTGSRGSRWRSSHLDQRSRGDWRAP